jgi:hypothetical protein
MKKQNASLNSWSSGTGSSITYPNSFKETPFDRMSSNQNPSSLRSSQTSISNSYDRMGGGKVGSLGGRMGELEKASVRLGKIASQRKMQEQKAEYGYQSKLQAQKAKEEADQQAREYFYNKK